MDITLRSKYFVDPATFDQVAVENLRKAWRHRTQHGMMAISQKDYITICKQEMINELRGNNLFVPDGDRVVLDIVCVLAALIIISQTIALSLVATGAESSAATPLILCIGCEVGIIWALTSHFDIVIKQPA